MNETPLVQLYSKRLDLARLDDFLAAEPDHVGWQVNLEKTCGGDLDRACDDGAAIVLRLRRAGVKSVFLVHPSDREDVLSSVLSAIGPDIFLASAKRSMEAVQAVKRTGAAREVMIPIGVPTPAFPREGYDPVDEVGRWAGLADWYTTDTITAHDEVDRFGCSGEPSDRGVLARVVVTATRPVVAAGGFAPWNLEALWRSCRPRGFDAHTAVCTEGLPDRDKSIRFAKAVRALR